MFGGKEVEVDAETQKLYLEYAERRREGRFRELFNVSHEEYLETPRLSVEWMFLVDNAMNEGALDKAKREAKS